MTVETAVQSGLTARLQRPEDQPEDRSGPAASATGPEASLPVLYVDFTCAWSYLASRRAAVLAASGGPVLDVRAVEPTTSRGGPPAAGALTQLRATAEQVVAQLLPGEELPYSLAGFVSRTKAAVTAYAEAYGAGVADRVRHLLFEAFWVNGVDVGDPYLVRTLLVDAVRSGNSQSETLRRWGYSVDGTGGPITMTGWRLIRQWREQWSTLGVEAMPLLLIEDTAPLVGTAAVEWLGAELVARGLEGTPPSMVHDEHENAARAPSHPSVPTNGSRRMQTHQHAGKA